MTTHILLIDNYDSFTFNLQHLLLAIPNVTLTIKRNDDPFLEELEAGKYAGVVISPGPGSAEDKNYFGFNNQVILNFGTQGLPVLGICLGFQGIYNCFGGKLKVSNLPMHGKVSSLKIDSNGLILNSIPDGIHVMRYHSIMADLKQAVPECLRLTAYTHPCKSQTANGTELMALEHKEHPIYGLQFHPESFATEYGDRIMENFIGKCISN
ncbi:aminodeoxychorismate/anthranilate synthase component II [Candidatus Halobeggiatoa sp. HSG11]|nr:aminodeoxychorismate/anthranilate synthase component II [Candidatus Halobeggiatoa sp. HSG11]